MTDISEAKSPRAIRWLVLALLAAMLVGALVLRSPERLDRAIEEARQYELVDGPAPYTAVDLRPLTVLASDWRAQYAEDQPSFPNVGLLSPAGLGELVVLAKAVHTTCADPQVPTVELPHDVEEELRLLGVLTAIRTFVSAAKGDEPSLGLSNRFDTLLAALHLSKALTQRHSSGLLVGAVALTEIREGYDACLSDGLILSQAQRAALVSVLESMDLRAEVRRAHRGAVAALRAGADGAPRGGLSRVIYRLGGRSTTDGILALELAVAVQKELTEEDTEANRKAREELLAEASRLDPDKYPQAGMGARLYERFQTTQASAAIVQAWLAELRSASEGR